MKNVSHAVHLKAAKALFANRKEWTGSKLAFKDKKPARNSAQSGLRCKHSYFLKQKIKRNNRKVKNEIMRNVAAVKIKLPIFFLSS